MDEATGLPTVKTERQPRTPHPGSLRGGQGRGGGTRQAPGSRHGQRSRKQGPTGDGGGLRATLGFALLRLGLSSAEGWS